MRRNQSGTILDSMGTASGERFIEEVQNRLDATHMFKGWYVRLGHSAQQQNAIDCGIFCVANAAYILSGRSVPSKINALFRRLACRTAIGLQDTTHPKNLAQSKFFANLQGRGERKQVLAAVRQSADNEGTQVLQNLCKTNQGHCHLKQWLALVDRLVERMERYEAELPQDEASTPRADSASRSGIWAAVEDIVTSEEHSGGGGGRGKPPGLCSGDGQIQTTEGHVGCHACRTAVPLRKRHLPSTNAPSSARRSSSQKASRTENFNKTIAPKAPDTLTQWQAPPRGGRDAHGPRKRGESPNTGQVDGSLP